jgi:hypothetical protein
MRIHPQTNRDVKYPKKTLFKKLKQIFQSGLSSRKRPTIGVNEIEVKSKMI